MQQRLYPFQREGVEYALSHHYSINACEMGLGKTAQAVTLLDVVREPTVIICPAYLKKNWLAEYKKFTSPYDTLDGPLVVSYEEFTKVHSKLTRKHVVIFDEAHYLKNMQAKRTKAAHKFVKETKPTYLLLLTGTPIKNRVAEFYSLLKLCSYNPKGTSGLPITKSYTHFADALSYRQEIRLPFGGKAVKYTGLKNKPLLLKYLKGKFFRRLARDVLDLPRTVTNYVPTDVGCRQLDEELMRDFDEGSNHISTAKTRSALSKVGATVKLATDVFDTAGGPVLIFSDHVEPCRNLAKSLLKRGRTARVDGSTPPFHRAALVDDFQAGRLDFLVCTIGSMSTGFTLTATGRIIFNDLSWCPADNAQSAARAVRIGQDKTVFITFVVSSGIDEQIARTLEQKMQVLDEVNNASVPTSP